MQIIRSHTVALHLDGRLLLYRCSSYVFCVYVPGLRDPGTDTALFQVSTTSIYFTGAASNNFCNFRSSKNWICAGTYPPLWFEFMIVSAVVWLILLSILCRNCTIVTFNFAFNESATIFWYLWYFCYLGFRGKIVRHLVFASVVSHYWRLHCTFVHLFY